MKARNLPYNQNTNVNINIYNAHFFKHDNVIDKILICKED